MGFRSNKHSLASNTSILVLNYMKINDKILYIMSVHEADKFSSLLDARFCLKNKFSTVTVLQILRNTSVNS